MVPASILLLCAAAVATPGLAGEVAWQPEIEIAAGRSVRGKWQQNDSRYDYVDDPSVALAGDGSAVVAWVDQGRKDVFLRHVGSGAEVNVSRSPATFSWLPRVTLAPGNPGRIFVLWQEIIFSGGSHGGDILIASSGDGGASFSEPHNLSSSAAGDGKGRINRDVWHNGSLDLAAASDGSLYAAWTEYEGALWVARSRDGTSFERLKIEQAKPARGPALAVGPDGSVYLAWTVGEDDSADIHLARSRDGGASFEAPRIVERTRGYSDAPKLGVDRAGILHLVYAESSGGPFERSRVRYARSSDLGSSFEPSRALSAPGGAFPALGVDARGGVYVVWELFREHRHLPRGLGFAVSRDGGASFSPAAPIPGSADRRGHWNGSRQGLLMKKLAVDERGEIAVVNSSLRHGMASRVWLIRAS